MRTTFTSQRLGIFIFLIIGLTVVLVPAPSFAKIHHKHHKSHAGVDGSASYADIVIDAESGRILHATDPDMLRHPASLTKMMTLYLTFEAIENGQLRLDQSLPISANAAEQSPSKLGLRRGQHIKVEDAILGVVTESANDAAMVLAEAIGGSESHFGEMMTQKAHALGMAHSNFHNPNGLPDPVITQVALLFPILHGSEFPVSIHHRSINRRPGKTEAEGVRQFRTHCYGKSLGSAFLAAVTLVD